MMVTLTKLLAIRIVANVLSESSRSMEMLLSAGFFSGSRLSRSCGDKLKNAISEPLAKPDNKSKKAARRAANRTPVVIGWKTTRSLMCCMSVKSNFTYYLLFAFNYFSTKVKTATYHCYQPLVVADVAVTIATFVAVVVPDFVFAIKSVE